MKISLCMIVRDEEEVLDRCLGGAAPLVDELVVVDTGSHDRTKEIASRYTDRIFDFVWKDDFSAARNEAFRHATGDYLFWLDADDVIPPEEREKFPALRAFIEETGADVVMCPYRTGNLVYERERIVRNCPQAVFRGRVHECMVPFGKRVRGDLTVVHLGSGKERGARNLDLYRKWAEEQPLSGRDLFYYGRELFYHKLYTEAIAVLSSFLGGEGWYVNKIEACKVLSACFRDTGRIFEALGALFSSFAYGEPRASVLCEIGELFKQKNEYHTAAYWFEAALSCRDHCEEGDFELPAARGLWPLLELVVLYDRLGDRERALFYHKKSEALAPDHPSVKFNRTYFVQTAVSGRTETRPNRPDPPAR